MPGRRRKKGPKEAHRHSRHNINPMTATYLLPSRQVLTITHTQLPVAAYIKCNFCTVRVQVKTGWCLLLYIPHSTRNAGCGRLHPLVNFLRNLFITSLQNSSTFQLQVPTETWGLGFQPDLYHQLLQQPPCCGHRIGCCPLTGLKLQPALHMPQA